MLRTIQFDNQLSLITIKINDIMTHYILPAKLYRICFQKLIPQSIFLTGHISQRLIL